MYRILLCLSLCLLLAPARYQPLELIPASVAQASDEGPFATVSDDGSSMPSDATLQKLAGEDPCAFMEWCIRHCQRDVRGVRLILRKHDRTLGVLRAPEVIAVDYRVQPFGVLFHWRQNPGLATAVLYSPDERPGKLLVRPIIALFGNIELDVDGDDAKRSGRYSLTEFGFETAMRRTLASWRKARRENALHVEFLGIQNRDEVSGRECFVFRRSNYARAEEADGVRELTLLVDREHLLQTGSVLKNGAGEVLGQYYFDRMEINPKFQPDRFGPKGLTQPHPAGI